MAVKHRKGSLAWARSAIRENIRRGYRGPWTIGAWTTGGMTPSYDVRQGAAAKLDGTRAPSGMHFWFASEEWIGVPKKVGKGMKAEKTWDVIKEGRGSLKRNPRDTKQQVRKARQQKVRTKRFMIGHRIIDEIVSEGTNLTPAQVRAERKACKAWMVQRRREDPGIDKWQLLEEWRQMHPRVWRNPAPRQRRKISSSRHAAVPHGLRLYEVKVRARPGAKLQTWERYAGNLSIAMQSAWAAARSEWGPSALVESVKEIPDKFAAGYRQNPGLKQGQGYLRSQLKHLQELRRAVPRGSDDHRKLGEMVDLLKDRIKRTKNTRRNPGDARGWDKASAEAYNAGLTIGRKAKASGFDRREVLVRALAQPPAGAPTRFLGSFVQGVRHGLGGIPDRENVFIRSTPYTLASARAAVDRMLK